MPDIVGDKKQNQSLPACIPLIYLSVESSSFFIPQIIAMYKEILQHLTLQVYAT